MKDNNKNSVGILLFSKHKKKTITDVNIQRIIEETTKLGFNPKIFYYDLFSVSVTQDKVEIYYNNKKINTTKISFIISFYDISLGKELTRENWFIAECMEQVGIKVFNSTKAAKIVQNKRDTYLKLSKQKIPIIPTFINFSEFNLGKILSRHKKETIIAKSANGLQGYGTVILKSHISFISFMEFLINKYPPSNLLIQPFINFEQIDYRIFVVGNNAIAGIRRKANGIEFRSNISKGGNAKKIKPTEKIKKMSVKAVKILGLDFAGVDIGIDKKTKKHYIIEVNGLNPGLKIEKITNTNIAGEIVKHCAKKSK